MPGRLGPKPLPRRDFLGLAGWWTAGLAIAGSLLGMARLPKPRVTPEASRRFRLGKASDFPPGTVKVFPEYKVRVSSTEGGFAAISLVCTHLGCIVKETEEGFACPCHGSKFDERGKVTGGPAPRGLPWFALTRAADGSLVVDTGKEVVAGTFYTT